MKRRSVIAKDLRTPKYRIRIIKDKRREELRRACRKQLASVAKW